MKAEDIINDWNADSKMDRTELAKEALKISELHHKYYKILFEERNVLKKMESDLKKLKLDKYEFYAQGHNEETKSKGWKLPAKGMILKGDIPMYIESDEDIINLSLRIGYQHEKVEMLDSIIRMIMNRNYSIKSAIDFIKFTNGV